MKRTPIILLLFVTHYITLGQIHNPVEWNFSSTQTGDKTFELSFTATISDGWHMYGLNIPENGPVPTSFNFKDDSGIEFVTEMAPSNNPKIKRDDIFEMDVELYGNTVRFTQVVKVINESGTTLSGYIEYMACDDSRCLPPREVDFSFMLNVNTTPTKTKTIETAATELNKPKSEPQFKTKNTDFQSSAITANIGISNPADDTQANDTSTEQKSLLRLFLIAVLAGFGALLTPCVYPIIPLTVSFFMRDTSHSKAILNGLTFGISIVFIYTLVGFIVGIFKIDLVRLIASHWLPNLIFFLIFMALAFSFFGMFEITLPGSLSNKIDQQADKGGFLGPFFMALATVIISFSCTGPIVGVVLGSALQGEIIKPVIGMLGFSLSFALPFTLLAIFPGFLKKLPKSGGWLNAVKVFFAFILTAFALVFINNLNMGFVSRNLILSLYITIFMLLGFYLLGKLRFSHDSPVDHISVPRLFLAIASFSITIYLIPGLFGVPLKSIDPFLPENTSELLFSKDATLNSKNTHAGNVCSDIPKYSNKLHLPHGLQGYFDYDEALACAKQLNKPVLLDFAGHSCKNCKKMYAEVWSDPEVLDLLSNEFIIAALYTDDRTKLDQSDWITSSLDGKIKKTIGKKFNDLQISKFGTNALPLYAIVNQNGQVITTNQYYTYSNNIQAFIDFLKDGLRNFEP